VRVTILSQRDYYIDALYTAAPWAMGLGDGGEAAHVGEQHRRLDGAAAEKPARRGGLRDRGRTTDPSMPRNASWSSHVRAGPAPMRPAISFMMRRQGASSTGSGRMPRSRARCRHRRTAGSRTGAEAGAPMGAAPVSARDETLLMNKDESGAKLWHPFVLELAPFTSPLAPFRNALIMP